MHVDVRKAGEVIIVDLDGRLVSGVGDELLHEVTNALLAEGWKGVLLNLEKVDRVDSAGIGEVVAAIQLAPRFGSAVKLLRPRGQVQRVLELSQVLPLVDVFEDESEALAAFGPDSGELPEEPGRASGERRTVC